MYPDEYDKEYDDKANRTGVIRKIKYKDQEMLLKYSLDYINAIKNTVIFELKFDLDFWKYFAGILEISTDPKDYKVYDKADKGSDLFSYNVMKHISVLGNKLGKIESMYGLLQQNNGNDSNINGKSDNINHDNNEENNNNIKGKKSDQGNDLMTDKDIVSWIRDSIDRDFPLLCKSIQAHANRMDLDLDVGILAEPNVDSSIVNKLVHVDDLEYSFKDDLNSNYHKYCYGPYYTYKGIDYYAKLTHQTVEKDPIF